MKKPIIFMFSGQGSHYYQMGHALMQENPIFRHWMREADRLCQDQIGLSIIQELYTPEHKKSDVFNRTLLTHPAIYMVEYALAKTVLSVGITPDYVLGTSLGELTASVLAGVLSFEEGLQAVLVQAQMFEAHCPQGAMMAVMESPKLYETHPFMKDKSQLAALNFPSHFVVSGKTIDLSQIANSLKTEEIAVQDLTVKHAFHSPLIDEAAPLYLDFLKSKSLALKPPSLPFISCAERGILDAIPHAHFWDAVRQPIEFQATIEALERENNFIYLDLGPSGTLATFVKYNLKDTLSQSQTYALLSPFSDDVKNLATLSAWLSS